MPSFSLLITFSTFELVQLDVQAKDEEIEAELNNLAEGAREATEVTGGSGGAGAPPCPSVQVSSQVRGGQVLAAQIVFSQFLVARTTE